MIIGIQGGRGSFNEEAAQELTAMLGIADYEVRYCYTTTGVLDALTEGTIDCGVFATRNSTLGLIDETAAVVERYQFATLAETVLPVRHCVLAMPGVDLSHITEIMAHPAALAQCRTHLAARFPHATSVPGNETYPDGSAVAHALCTGNMSSTTATLGSVSLATLYGLQILVPDVHDDPTNATTFVCVARANTL